MKYVVTVRGRLKSADEREAQVVHDAIVARLDPVGQPLGALGHMPMLNPQDRREFQAMDTWNSLEGIQQFMTSSADPGSAIGSMFEAPPEVTIWAEAGWTSFMREG